MIPSAHLLRGIRHELKINSDNVCDGCDVRDGFVVQTVSRQSTSGSTSQVAAKPLLLEKNEGERRIWRDPPPGDFMLKLSPKNNDSQHLAMATEDMAPGEEFPTHKHLGQDTRKRSRSNVGDRERDLHAGGTVFIPAYTWVRVKNVGPGIVSVVGVFSAPGFENLYEMREHIVCKDSELGAQE